MNIQQLRESLKQFISGTLRIDEWGVDLPKTILDEANPPSIGLDQPAKIEDSGYPNGYGSPVPIVLKVTFPFQILYRFHSAYKYEDLPRGELEAKLLELRVKLRMHLMCLDSDILPESFKAISTCAIARQENKDWIAVCKISIEFEIRAETEEIYLESPLFDALGE